MTPLDHDEGTLQPFVPDFSGFAVVNGADVGPADARYGNQGSHLQSSYNLPTPAYHHSRSGPAMQQSEFYQSQSRGQGFPDHPVPVHQRPTSGGPSRPGQQSFRQEQGPNDPSTGKISPAPLPPCPQIEDVASWSTISFFISLHLRYQHPIMPIIHKPTFNNDLALRLDRQDEQFRAFLLSLGESLFGRLSFPY